MDLVVVLGVIAIVVVAVTAYVVFAPRNVQPQRVPAVPKVPGLNLKPLAEVPQPPPPPPPRPVVPASPAPLFDLDLEPPVVSPPPQIRWSTQFDPRSGALDDTARLRLIGDLGVVAKEWCVPLLAAAYEQERRPGHRQAALIALAACRSRAAARTFRLALASDDPAEAAIAADGLADLEPPPQAKLRRTVERH